MNQNDLTVEVKLHRIGSCPVCGKGQMLQGTAGWTCDYFHSLDDKCTFTIFQSYQGYELNEQDAVELITKGSTGLRNFRTMSGKHFTAVLKRVCSKVKVVAADDLLALPCPTCGGRVRETEKGYVCEHYFTTGAGHCGFYLSKSVCGRSISLFEAEELLEHGQTEVMDGFFNQGKFFSSCLVVAPDGTPMLDGRVCRCPKCGGTVYAGIKGYNCSNYRDPSIQCDFVVWRVTGKRKITIDDVRKLCANGRTRVMKFQTMDGRSYESYLSIGPDFKVRIG